MSLASLDMTRRSTVAAARRAVAAVFAFNGFAFASWAVRVPDVSHQVDASHAGLGAALLCISLGALATMRPTGALCERLGPGLVSVVAATLVSLTLALPGLVTSMAALCVALAAFGAAGGMLNVAMNSSGVGLETTTGRPVLSRLHAGFSFGGLAGGLAGGIAAAWLDPGLHLAAVGAAGLLVTGVLSRPLLALDDRPARPRAGGSAAAERVPLPGLRTVLVLGAVAGAAAYGEGALSDWGTLHLVEDLGASPTVAAGGYAAFCLAMGCGRLAGRRLLTALGPTSLTVAGSLLAAAGMLLVALAPSVVAAFAGLVLAGLGFSNIFPVAIARAGALAGSRGVGLASTVGYGGLLVGPAAIGFIAAGVGLPVALTTVSVLAAVASGLALLVRSEAPAGPPWLPGAAAWTRSRVRPELLVARCQAAAVRHAVSLEALDPRLLGASRTAAPLRDRGEFTDLAALFGWTAARAPSAGVDSGLRRLPVPA